MSLAHGKFTSLRYTVRFTGDEADHAVVTHRVDEFNGR